MSLIKINQTILNKAKEWLKGGYDENTKKQVQELIDNNPSDLIESFYKDLEFGTGGLRGIMGVGTNRMNKYTVGRATQGLANYLKKCYPNEQIKIAIAYDSRNNNTFFANVTAEIMSANGIYVYLYKDIRPTPQLSFTIRELKCQSGIVITASHNPKEYNGYKVYWADGGQLINPHDDNVIEEAKKISSIDEINFIANNSLIEIIGKELDDIYVNKIKELSLSQKCISKHNDISIVFTSLHGTGITMVPRCIKEYGFTNLTLIESQSIADGNFPTVKSPNPEEPAALELAIKKANEINADIVMGTDPDADRVGVAVRNNKNELELLNGNQTATILIYYLLSKWKETERLTGNEYIVKTIVTTELLKDIAINFNVDCFDVLTGFKYIADIIKKNEGLKTFIGGGEESYGYLVSDFVRDKDAVISCCMIAEIAAWAKSKNKTIFDLLLDIYVEFGFYKEELLSITKKGKAGTEEIQSMMDYFRKNPFNPINGQNISKVKDYQSKLVLFKNSEDNYKIDLPSSNVLQFYLEDESIITIRPSGTEPKIKFYFCVKDHLLNITDFDTINQKLELKIKNIITSLNL